MRVDHGGLGPPLVNKKPCSTTDTIRALIGAIDKHLQDSEKRQRETDDNFKKFEKITAEYFAKFAKQNKRGSMPPSNIQKNTLLSAIDMRTKAQEDCMESDPSQSPTDSPINSTATSPNKSRLIVSSTKFPDPTNCAIFSQRTTREEAPCWFHKESGRAAPITMIQQEALERGPKRPHKLHPGAPPTTQSPALLGATCSAEHYNAFRRPPPARDKNQARRVPQKQAKHKNEYFKISSKLTRGATLTKEHYQAFRKPPPTRDRKHDWTKNHHE
jgi:hypothetical protein